MSPTKIRKLTAAITELLEVLDAESTNEEGKTSKVNQIITPSISDQLKLNQALKVLRSSTRLP